VTTKNITPAARCKACHDDCAVCDGSRSTDCITCRNKNKKLVKSEVNEKSGHECIDSCPVGKWYNLWNRDCGGECNPFCKRCISDLKCLECQPDRVMVIHNSKKHWCERDCPLGEHHYGGPVCFKCDYNTVNEDNPCQICDNYGCLVCDMTKGYVNYLSDCVHIDSVPAGYYVVQTQSLPNGTPALTREKIE
jgi:hypothetical protein